MADENRQGAGGTRVRRAAEKMRKAIWLFLRLRRTTYPCAIHFNCVLNCAIKKSPNGQHMCVPAQGFLSVGNQKAELLYEIRIYHL